MYAYVIYDRYMGSYSATEELMVNDRHVTLSVDEDGARLLLSLVDAINGQVRLEAKECWLADRADQLPPDMRQRIEKFLASRVLRRAAEENNLAVLAVSPLSVEPDEEGYVNLVVRVIAVQRVEYPGGAR